MTRKIKKYSDQFRLKAVGMVLKEGLNTTETASKLGIHPSTVRRWIKKLESTEPQETYAIEEAEVTEEQLLQLYAEIQKLKKELDVLAETADTMGK